MLFEDIRVQYTHSQRPKHVRTDTSRFLLCLSTPQWTYYKVSFCLHTLPHLGFPLVSNKTAKIPSSFRSNWLNHELSVGTRKGRSLRLAVYSTR